MSPGAAPALLSIRLLGDLALARGSLAVPLPASKRTRALLGYLVTATRAQPRAALCDLLWEGPDDPRAALRWSLTKLRPLVDDNNVVRLVADRERVAFEAQGAVIDVEVVQALLSGGVAAASLEALEEAAQALRGEFLDGLDLPACYRFHHWCVGERERYGLLRRAVLETLVQRLAADAARALPYGRAMVAADPLVEGAHATLVRLLGAAARYPDAETHYSYARDLLRREVSAPPGGPLDEAIHAVRHEVRTQSGSTKPVPPQRPADLAAKAAAEPHLAAPTTLLAPVRTTPLTTPLATQLVGRHVECLAMATYLAAPERAPGRLLLFVGEPGIGKTRLLAHLAESAVAAGWQVIRGRCYEAEMVRPYGLWLDALRTIDASAIASEALGDAATLLGVRPGAEPTGDRARLFAAAAALIRALASARPLVLALDDLQWIDEGSAALLHYIARTQGAGAPVLLAGAARAGEIDDNGWAKGLLQSLVREQRLERFALAPLDAAQAAALLGACPIEPERAWRESGGNPLYLLALAGAYGHADASAGLAGAAAGAGTRTLDVLLAAQIEALDEASGELLAWAAALGREWHPELIAAAMGAPVADVLARLGRLERRGLLKAGGDGRLEFTHDLLRQAVYRLLSQARRRAIHRQLAQALALASREDPRLHGEVAHHAGLAADALLAARACLAAGEQCLRLFANGEAAVVAERGLAHADSLAQGAERVHLTIALLKLRVVAAASPGARRLPALVARIEQAIEAADALALHAEAASALHILSWLSQQSNDTERTHAATLQAERLTRQADAATRCQQQANTGRCLLEVEADMPRARALIAEAEVLAQSLELKVVELIWGQGLVARADGDPSAARSLVERSVALARLRQDHWREYECRVWLALLDYECGAFAAVLEHRSAVVALARRMGDADAPFAQALGALARLHLSAPADAAAARTELEASLDALRSADDQAHLAYALNAAAAMDLAAGLTAAATERAREALKAARRVRRPSQVVQALATLVQAAAGGEAAAAQEQRALLMELRRCAIEHPSARTQAALVRAESAARQIPTLAPTLPP